MAEQIIKGSMAIPSAIRSYPSFISTLLDAADEKASFIIQAPKTGTISKVGFLTGTVATGATVDVRLETLTGNDPSGTLLGTDSNGSQVIADTDDDTWFTVPLTTGVAVTKGTDIFAVVIVNPSASPGNLNIKHLASTVATVNFPYINDYVGGVWVADNETPCCALEYSDGTYEHIPGVYPVSAIDIAVAFSNASDPDHRGLKFKLPSPHRITGVWLSGDLNGDFNIKLYDSDGTTVLETLSVSSSILVTKVHDKHFYLFTSTYSLSKDVFYRVVIEPNTATTLDLNEHDVYTVAIMDSFEGGQDFHYTEKKDAGWTDTTTKRPWMGILINAFDDGAGGAGETIIGNPNALLGGHLNS